MKSFTIFLICIFLTFGLSYVCAEKVDAEEKNALEDNNEFQSKLNLLLSKLESDEENDDESNEDGLHKSSKRLAYRYGKRMNYRYGKRAAMPYRFGKRTPDSNGLNAQEILDFIRMNPNTESKRLSYRYGK